MTEAEFTAAVVHVRQLSASALAIAHADLVRGVLQEEIAKEHGITKSSVSQASKRVWLGFLKSKGYEEVAVVLPKVRAFMVQQWSREALESINGQQST